MKLAPEVSLGVTLATAAVVYSVYQNGMPTVADARMGQPGDPHLNGSRKTSSWIAAGVVGGISLLAKDPTVFVVGGAMIIGLDWWYRHADAVNPMTGKASMNVPMPAAPGAGDVVPGVYDTAA